MYKKMGFRSQNEEEYKPLIGILVAKKKNKKKIINLYQKYCELNAMIFTFTPSDINWNSLTIHGLTKIDDEQKEISFPFPDAVYNRCYRSKIKIIDRLEKSIGKNKCFNYRNQLNKWEVYQALNKDNLINHLPKTYLLEEINLLELLNNEQSLVLKSCYGNQGRHVYKLEIKDQNKVYVYLDSTSPKFIWDLNPQILYKIGELLPSKKCIVQQHAPVITLKDNKYFDLRAIVQKNNQGKWQVTSIVSRVCYENFYNTSIYEQIFKAEEIIKQLFPFKTRSIIKKVIKVSLRAAVLVEECSGHLGEIGLDIGLDHKGNVWIIEVNGKPQKSIINDLADSNNKDEVKKFIYQKPLEYAYYLSLDT